MMAKRTATVSNTDSPLKQRTVVLVDDNPEERKRLGDILSRLGYQVRMARNGVEALLSTDNQAVDVIILDLIMPVMNGFETLYYLRREVATSQVPVILIASSRSKSIVQLPGVARVLAREEVSIRTLQLAIEDSVNGVQSMVAG